MPLQHSPKASPEKTTTVISQSSSTPDLSDISRPNVTARGIKRKQGDDMELFMNRMEVMFTNWTEQQTKKYEVLLETVNAIKEQNTLITTSLEYFSSKYDDIKAQMDVLQEVSKAEKLVIKSLEQKIEYLEQNARSTSLELRNVPVLNDEKQEDLCNIVKTMGNVIGAPISQSDIKNIHRGYSKSENNKPIIIDFTTTIIKNEMLSCYKQYNVVNKGSSNLSSSHLKIPGPSSKVFLSEYLTPKMKRLFFLAKDYASSHQFRFCWPTQSAIYLRKREGDKAIRIKNEHELQNLETKK